MRRKPADNSNAFGPSPATFFSPERLRNGPLASRWLTMFCATRSVRPETRDSSGPEAVFTSTPTPFTQSSTTASRERDSFPSGEVVLVLADADRLRLDLHEFGERVLQAPGDRDRAAQRHVEPRQFRAGIGEAE